MGHRARRALILVAVLEAGAVLGACASTPKPTTHHHHHQTTPTSKPKGSTGTTPTIPGLAACSTGVLGITTSAGGAAAGTSYTVFNLTNQGPTRCELDGYPSLEFFGPSGASGAGAGLKLPITSIDGGPAPVPAMLSSGGTAEFIIIVNDIPIGGVGCSTVASVDVAIPGTSEALAVPITLRSCGGSVTVYAFGPADSESP